MDKDVKLLAPVQQVFAIPELLECILINLGQISSLPGIQLCLLQQLNRTFQQAIRISIGLQQCMHQIHIDETNPYVKDEELASIR